MPLLVAAALYGGVFFSYVAVEKGGPSDAIAYLMDDLSPTIEQARKESQAFLLEPSQGELQ